MIVHCSAGIGRTGVLILMDTALALMEAREPVYPLDIVRTMRDQRACMVQNVVSFGFYNLIFYKNKVECRNISGVYTCICTYLFVFIGKNNTHTHILVGINNKKITKTKFVHNTLALCAMVMYCQKLQQYE